MESVKRITINLPSQLLEDAMHESGVNMTETIKLGLEMIRRRRALSIARDLRGTLDLKIDLAESRERDDECD